MSPQAELLDTLRAVETPEGITLDLRLAGPAPRALAWLIDSLIKYVILLGILLGLGFLGETGLGFWFLSLFLLEWFYPVLFELYWNGATPGKKAFSLQVINDNGTPVDGSASVIRNLLRAADFLPLFYGFGLVSLLVNRDFKRLGDLAAGTVVIYQERPVKPIPLPVGPSWQPLFPLSLTERRVLIDFAERSAALNPARRAELAGVLDVLAAFQNEHNTDAVETLLANARWLRGEQE